MQAIPLAEMDLLAALQKIEVKQQVEAIEALTGFEGNNRYQICDGAGRPFMMANEESSCCSRMCCGSRRPFTINLHSATGHPVATIIRDYKCLCFGQCMSCSSCCQDCVTVESPPGTVVGYVRQECSLCSANFTVRDANDQVALHLKGPCYCGCRCPWQSYKFKMLSADESQEIGKIKKVWSGIVKEALTDADNFSIEVPQDMAVPTKMTLIAAVLLIDFMFFEDNGGKKVETHKS